LSHGSKMADAMSASLHVNHAFLLDFAKRNGGTVLDYGCGTGEVVRSGLADNLDIYGCEAFYEGGCGGRRATSDLVLAGRIIEMKDGLIPFPDHSFDCIVNNMVFEHIDDIDLALSELNRVLKPGGHVLSLFPSVDVLREGHCGVPLAHRFCKSRFGYYWLLFFRTLGFGYFSHGKNRRVWAKDFQRWLKTYCFYRSEQQITAAFTKHGFATEPLEREYIKFRRVPFLTPALLRRFGFMVLLSTTSR
jgi:ubiquinone/menaquinone biosynthesis C-methylase UbiE